MWLMFRRLKPNKGGRTRSESGSRSGNWRDCKPVAETFLSEKENAGHQHQNPPEGYQVLSLDSSIDGIKQSAAR